VGVRAMNENCIVKMFEMFGDCVVEDLVERISEVEHEQWAHWTKYMLDNLTDENIARWRRQIETPYNQLTEREKESDREWARKAMFVAINRLKEIIPDGVK
jgi:hypothetical protein